MNPAPRFFKRPIDIFAESRDYQTMNSILHTKLKNSPDRRMYFSGVWLRLAVLSVARGASLT
jgi:hypothetical protein